jgi:hypothetical protein
MSVVNDTAHDTQLLAGIRVGLRKARELGYDVERMDVTASISREVCAVHFAPIPQPGFITAGGDLSLTINSQTEEVIECKRGQ